MNKSERYWELDLFRGTAVIVMILYHLLFDLTEFGLASFNIYGPYWKIFAGFWASVFFFLVGICLTISYNRAAQKINVKGLLKKFLLRGAKIFGWGLVISVVTYFLTPDRFILFGALHFIGFSIIAASLILIFSNRNAIKYFGPPLALAVVFLGFFLNRVNISSPWLIWAGITPPGFVSLDYFPIFPWFGSVVFGLWFGVVFYPKGKRSFELPDISKFLGLLTLGRHSLPIYLLHQPVIIFVLALIKREVVLF